MVTRDQLHEHLGRRPFIPFRVTLTDGETVYITRMAQAVASRHQFIVGDDYKDASRWIPLKEIISVEMLEAPRPRPPTTQG